MLKILIDINHPSDVHLFKNFAWHLQGKGSEILFITREREDCILLLKEYGFNYICIGSHHKKLIRKIVGLFVFSFRIYKIAINFKPDIFLSHGSMYAAWVAKIMRKPCILSEDTGNLEQVLLYKPFTDVILTPQSFKSYLGRKQIKFRGYMEMAYLHPKYYRPDKNILDILGIKTDEKFVILRFSSHDATHDFGYKGIPLKYKIECVEKFSKYAKVFISSETRLAPYLEKFRIKIAPEKIHDVLNYATLVYSEGAKTAIEAAILGTPAIYLDFKGRDCLRDQEKRYGTIFNYSISRVEIEKSIQKGIEILNKAEVKQEWNEKRKKIINENIDLTAFLIWFIEKYPESFKILKNNLDFNLNLIKKQI